MSRIWAGCPPSQTLPLVSRIMPGFTRYTQTNHPLIYEYLEEKVFFRVEKKKNFFLDPQIKNRFFFWHKKCFSINLDIIYTYISIFLYTNIIVWVYEKYFLIWISRGKSFFFCTQKKKWSPKTPLLETTFLFFFCAKKKNPLDIHIKKYFS